MSIIYHLARTFASTIFRLRKVPKPFIYGHSTTFTRICNKKMRIKHQSVAEQWFTALFMLKCGKDYDMKTNIRVVSCFDGDREAEDFFTDMIAEKIRAEGKIIPFPKNGIYRAVVETRPDICYIMCGLVCCSTFHGGCQEISAGLAGYCFQTRLHRCCGCRRGIVLWRLFEGLPCIGRGRQVEAAHPRLFAFSFGHIEILAELTCWNSVLGRNWRIKLTPSNHFTMRVRTLSFIRKNRQ